MSTSSTQSIRWKAASSGGNALGQRFPSFQFDAEDVLSGKIKAFARSPSGRTQALSILDTDGLYNANFTPDEVGTCFDVCRMSQPVASRKFGLRGRRGGALGFFQLGPQSRSDRYSVVILHLYYRV